MTVAFELTPERIVELLDLEPLPDEGGRWAQVWLDEAGSAIVYLVTADDFSALHRLPGPEIYHHYAGAPVVLTLLGPGGEVRRPVLGPDLEAGERPAVVVPGGWWQGSATRGAWSLVGTTMAPPFRFEDFELGDRASLLAAYPGARDEIEALTR